MDVAAFVIACFGAVLAVLSLGWQIAAWMLEGRRVRVVLSHGAIGVHGAAVGAVERDGQPKDLRNIRAQGFTDEEVVGITVTNIGRAPVTVSKYSVVLLGGALSFSPLADRLGPSFPHRLEPGDSDSWYARMSDVHALVSAASTLKPVSRPRIAMEVELGTGDKKRTARALSVSS